MKLVWGLLLFCALGFFSAQTSNVKVERWMAGFANIRILAVSKDQRFLAIHKTYKSNKDTVLVIDSKYPKHPVDTILKKPFISFLDNHLIVASGNDHAQLINLKTKQRKTFKNVSSTVILPKNRQFIIQLKNKMMQRFNMQGKLLSEFSNIFNVVTDSQERCYAVRNIRGKDELVMCEGKQIKTVYQSTDIIKKIEFLPSGRFLVITEEKNNPKLGILALTLLRTKDLKIFKSESILSSKTDRIKVTEINDTESFLIDFQKNIKSVQQEVVEVWYAGDKTLRDKKDGTKVQDFWLWNIKESKASEIIDKRFTDFIGMVDSRYLWAYHTDEAFSYIGDREYDFFLYDTQSQKAEKIFNRTSNLIASADGRFTLAYSKSEKRWVLYDHQLLEKKVLTYGKTFTNPIFTKENTILFETDSDIAKYCLKSGMLEMLNWGNGDKVSFYNFIPKIIHEFANVTADVRQWDSSKPLFFKIFRDKNNDTGYFMYKNNHKKEIIPFTGNKVRDFTYIENDKNFYSIEENFNIPGDLFERIVSESNKVIMYQGNPNDQVVMEMRQEIIRFKNSLGRELKGILYYPARFDTSKKYPMVVHIYGVLHTHANKFLQLEYGDNGFSKRLLIENGYFVFQPDIVVDERGPGVSALDCVHSALDAVTLNINIDKKKIGLIGHSFGGYETNFIATQSKRFRAFVSGASVGELVNFYFSFSDLFKIADYSRFETGQFAFDIPYAENKKLYFRNNPINYVENVSAPMLMWSGKKDANSTTAMTMNFYMGLIRNRKKAIVLLYPNQKHNLEKNSPEIIDLNNKVTEWWDYFLKDRVNIPWVNLEMNSN